MQAKAVVAEIIIRLEVAEEMAVVKITGNITMAGVRIVAGDDRGRGSKEQGGMKGVIVSPEKIDGGEWFDLRCSLRV